MLPTHLVIALIIAMSLWSTYSIEDVLQNLVQGLSGQWIRLSHRWKKPSKSSISEARQQIGPQVMSRLFHLVARPLGSEQTPGVLMLLMWDRGLYSFKMVKTTQDRGSHYLGRVPKNVKFEVVQTFEDGSFLSWIAPDRGR